MTIKNEFNLDNKHFHKFVWLILIILLWVSSIFAQSADYCGFKPVLDGQNGENLIGNESLPPYGDPSLLPDRQTTRILRLAIYRVLRSDHTGNDLSVNEINSLVEGINQFFLPVHIQFNLVNIEIIYDDDLSEGGSIPSNNIDPSCLNVYLIQSFPNSSQYGVASSNDARVIIDPQHYVKNHITQAMGISHELGHCLGLLHTFEREVYKVENITRIDTPTCLANHKTRGDAISDTEADDNGWGLTDNCGYSNYTRPRHNIL